MLHAILLFDSLSEPIITGAEIDAKLIGEILDFLLTK